MGTTSLTLTCALPTRLSSPQSMQIHRRVRTISTIWRTLKIQNSLWPSSRHAWAPQASWPVLSWNLRSHNQALNQKRSSTRGSRQESPRPAKTNSRLACTRQATIRAKSLWSSTQRPPIRIEGQRAAPTLKLTFSTLCPTSSTICSLQTKGFTLKARWQDTRLTSHLAPVKRSKLLRRRYHWPHDRTTPQTSLTTWSQA